jgi:hypothetical protein
MEKQMSENEWCIRCRHSSGYENALWCNVHDQYVEKYDWCRDFSWPQTPEGQGSGSCYIATATLQTGNRLDVLHQLRQWRAERMRPFRFGRWLESLYDAIGPQVVHRISANDTMRSWYYRTYILPASNLLRLRAKSHVQWLYDVVGYVILMGLIITGYLHVWVTKNR